MKNKRRINKVILICLLSLFVAKLFGQNATADKMILEIESFKRYEILKIDNKADLILLSDSTLEMTEVVNYQRKNKNDQSGKVTENSQNKLRQTKRTYYFNEKSVIFAIIDNIKFNDNTTNKVTYYFTGGQLTQVIDKNNIDITTSINKEELYDWIIRMFGKSAISK